MRPHPVTTTDTGAFDTSGGTVHMVLGGGGNSSTSNQDFFSDGRAKVITGVGAAGSNGTTPGAGVWSFTEAKSPVSLSFVGKSLFAAPPAVRSRV